MLAYFPSSYPEEIFYGICARFADQMKFRSHRVVLKALFGTESIIPILDLPCHLANFLNRLPLGHHYDVDRIIDRHTLLPYFAPFLASKRTEQIRNQMIHGNGQAIKMTTGIVASRIRPPQYLRYCPLCATNDRDQSGEYYWHRVHQIPGVLVCPTHNVWLQNSSALVTNRRLRQEFITAESSINLIEQKTVILDLEYRDLFLQLAKDTLWLLQQTNLNWGPHQLRETYMSFLEDRGLVTPARSIRLRDLMEQFITKYPTKLLLFLGCPLENNITENWLIRFFHSPDNAQHPLHHLLMIHYLGIEVQDFFKPHKEREPFGKPPWPCLNPVSEHYLQPRIQVCSITTSSYTSVNPIGTFACDCGYVYSRTGADRSPDEWLTADRVLSYGPIWQAFLQDKWQNPELSLRSIAFQLRVDSLTVKRQAVKLGLSYPRAGMKNNSVSRRERYHPITQGNYSINDQSKHRAAWQTTVEKYPNMGVNFVRNISRADYAWLYRHDRNWLKCHLPGRKKSKQSPCRIDWHDRDVIISHAVSKSAVQLRQAQERPKRFSITAIARETGHLAVIEKHGEKLPLTLALLIKLAESRSDFAIRRVLWAIKDFHRMKIIPKRWELVKRAGVERLMHTKVVKEAIDQAMKLLDSRDNIPSLKHLVDKDNHNE